MNNKMIGIVGGVGSYAGIDLIKKIYDNTGAECDQQHLPVSMVSEPHSIVDRTDFLLGRINTNPGDFIGNVVNKLAEHGSQVIGIPCNTAHAPIIFDQVMQQLPSTCKLVHMIEEVAQHIIARPEKIKTVGVLGTTGTISADVYSHCLAKYNIEVLYPSEDIQRLFVHPAIYNKVYGIKSCSNPVDEKAKIDLTMACSILARQGADAIILGCTEIPLAINQLEIDNTPLIDATEILAKALIRESLRAGD